MERERVGTRSHQAGSAHRGREAKHMVAPRQGAGEFARGLALGLSLGLLALCLLVWLWMVPTIDACLAEAQQAQSVVGGVLA